ncbi:SIMPL domain-containing protein [Geobacillus sp. LEMMY01]|uniref:SIMPL domain-containing protein n=1 Tax=Geobacillus sp. LEMMY01 TaxID=1954237 RepID=UPI0009AD3EA1|nr:SIMPL domain-containing protein [Geobacillus sp. LEMMY01]OPX02681.1 SIMPL domain-containing protein [Geobacillus sp. LEMMY01]
MQPWHRPTPPTASRAALTVTGQGTVSAKPDTVLIALGVRTEHVHIQEALADNAKRTDAVIGALKALGVQTEDLETTAFSIYPQYEHHNGADVLSSYGVEHWLEITVRDPKKAGAIYEAAVAHGANLARGLEFRLANEQAHYQQALALAVKNAKEKALAIARALSLPLYDTPIELKEQSSIRPTPYGPTVLSVSSSAPPVQTQDVVITAVVEAVFAYSFIS